jgi:translation initiation factor IF-1
MARSDMIELEGIVEEVLPGTKFMVRANASKNPSSIGKLIKCTLSGKLRKNYIKILLGDSVIINVSPYDLNSGIITWRNK